MATWMHGCTYHGDGSLKGRQQPGPQPTLLGELDERLALNNHPHVAVVMQRLDAHLIGGKVRVRVG